MYTSEGRYFTGTTVSWRVTPERNGTVQDIEVVVKAWDNEGRKFTSSVIQLSKEYVKLATTNTRGHQDVVAALIRNTYVEGCAAETAAALLAKIAEKAPAEPPAAPTAPAEEVKEGGDTHKEEGPKEPASPAESKPAEGGAPVEQVSGDVQHAEGTGPGNAVADGKNPS